MKRLYFLIPNVESATEIVKALLERGVANEGIHVIVKDGDPLQDKLALTQLLEPGIFEKTDILRALIRGAIVGGLAGLITGFLIVQFPPEEFVLGSGTIIAFTVFGAIFGAWSSSLIGISVPNPMFEKFERAVEAGGIMMLVDIPNGKEVALLDYMRLNHPEITIHGVGLPPIQVSSDE